MAFDAYLKIDGVDGQCPDSGHEKWIGLLAYSHGVQLNPGPRTTQKGVASGKSVHNDFHIVKNLDVASPHLALRASDGTVAPKAKVEIFTAGGKKVKVAEYEMENVIITSVQISGSTDPKAHDTPVENVTLNYTKIKWSYYPVSEKGVSAGAVTTSWDLLTKTK